MQSSLSVLFLNTWAARRERELIKFLQSPSKLFDIMCLTEVSHLKGTLPKTYVHLDQQGFPALLDAHNMLTGEFNRFYEHRYDAFGEEQWTCQNTGDMYHSVMYGSSLFYLRRGAFKVISTGVTPIDTGYAAGKARALQWLCINLVGKKYLIAHLHGVLIKGNTKGDSPERQTQTRLVRTELIRLLAKHKADRLIFGGDLNLDLDTEAMRRHEGWGGDFQLRNLIREKGVSNTRTPLYRGYNEGGTLHADHVLVTPNVEVANFDVLNDVHASDHAPLVVYIK